MNPNKIYLDLFIIEMNQRRILCLFLLAIFILNFLYLLGFLNTEKTKNEIFNYSDDQMKANHNEILLKLNIMDIYRLDISCNYVIDALGESIDHKYRNDFRKCALAVTKEDVNKFIQGSLTDDYANQLRSKIYKPYLENTRFDPFNDETANEFEQFKSLKKGGHWSPSESTFKSDGYCKPNDLEFIVFIVPFSRNRIENLKYFLINIHSYLQNLKYPFEYRIIVAEQRIDSNTNQLFNKGSVMNRAVQYALDNYKQVDCIVMHDVDIIPFKDSQSANDGADYRCNLMPSHLTRRVFLKTTEKVRLYNQFLTGGILSLRPQHIITANGYSNQYFGWGGEDDDWTLRMFNKKLCIMRPKSSYDLTIGDGLNQTYFLMLKHAPSRANDKRFNDLTNALARQNADGLNKIKSFTNVLKAINYVAFTHLEIEVISN